MQKIQTLWLALVLLLAACQQTAGNLGESFQPGTTIGVDEAIEKVAASGPQTSVQIEGTVYKSCMSEGCWLTIKDKTGKEILFNVKEDAFKIPINSPEKTVILLADVEQDTTADAEQPVAITVRGMRFK